MSERSSDEMTDHLREADRWLRKVAIYLPILTFILGWGSGVITTYLVFKDHERRISILEKGQADQNMQINNNFQMLNRVVGLLENEHHINLH